MYIFLKYYIYNLLLRFFFLIAYLVCTTFTNITPRNIDTLQYFYKFYNFGFPPISWTSFLAQTKPKAQFTHSFASLSKSHRWSMLLLPTEIQLIYMNLNIYTCIHICMYFHVVLCNIRQATSTELFWKHHKMNFRNNNLLLFLTLLHVHIYKLTSVCFHTNIFCFNEGTIYDGLMWASWIWFK